VLQEGLRFSTYLDDYTSSLRKDAGDGQFAEWMDDQRVRDVIDPFAYLKREPFDCLVGVADEHETPGVAARLQTHMGATLRVMQTTPTLIECALPDVSKARAAEVLTARLGIARADVLALGDNENDVDMLRWAGLGVAVGSATPAARAAAAEVVGSVSQDGAAEAIRRFILPADPAAPAMPPR
jgi:hydroxymethylpyrimidine pyrophosphatase-like HAD family hydrolase